MLFVVVLNEFFVYSKNDLSQADKVEFIITNKLVNIFFFEKFIGFRIGSSVLRITSSFILTIVYIIA